MKYNCDYYLYSCSLSCLDNSYDHTEQTESTTEDFYNQNFHECRWSL